ncbi:glucose-6-phosphate isomerase [Pseudovibrio sp. Tun.PSC04-5.I4]|uniref:glucose-6-phosphate isomerase n=1 Tax=Pseudovibrio sp. Tun.PSC04-5.I4 TaxID=1798213 RepID=UPI00087EA9B0|nr:glucose-6-phosphate isomerase [Pseudovibrio sp. Tun.PSC04-5.I4]SDR48888.1 glucose-6-phosphate isomerase [Pseudovibrio sp. Tun.PSC04-5.I4]
MIKLDNQYLDQFIGKHEFKQLTAYGQLALQQIREGSGAGNQFLGWVDLPDEIKENDLSKIKETAKHIKSKFDCFVCIGIGGSYLGHKAIIEALSPAFKGGEGTEIIFAAHTLSGRYLREVLDRLAEKNYCINVIAKEGIALETAVTFRILKHVLEQRFGPEGARERIFVTTDQDRGPLKDMVAAYNYPLFHLPNEVGGRFSVFTPVGLLPLAVAGIDITALIEGAKAIRKDCLPLDADHNPALNYALARKILYQKGKAIELLVTYEPYFTFIAEWWKQLFGESEGKDGKGLFPASALYSTDLHSLGQYVQEGRRHFFETTVSIGQEYEDVCIPNDPDDIDNLNFLEGRSLQFIQDSILEASLKAHTQGDVPNILITVEKLDAYHLGGLLYFFMELTVNLGDGVNCGVS